MSKEKQLSLKQTSDLLLILKSRFEKNINRSKYELDWSKFEEKLMSNPKKLWSLNEIERTGGEPNLVRYDNNTDEYFFYDCSAETPKDRRSLCYDLEAMESRKENKPENNVMDKAYEMGIELLDENQYRELQNLGNFDTKTSSWIKTPDEIRKLGGALFADFRYGKVFVYHNSAPSYYASRAFRGWLSV